MRAGVGGLPSGWDKGLARPAVQPGAVADSSLPASPQAWCETNLRRCISEQHRFVCDTCDKAFPMLSSLTLHKQTHVAANQSPDRLQARAPPGDDLDQKVFLAVLGLRRRRSRRQTTTRRSSSRHCGASYLRSPAAPACSAWRPSTPLPWAGRLPSSRRPRTA